VPSIRLDLDLIRQIILSQALGCFAYDQRNRARSETSASLAAERQAWADDADAVRDLVQDGARTDAGRRTAPRSPVPIDLLGDRWFVLTEALERWADLHEQRDGVDRAVRAARDLVDSVDQQIDSLERRRMLHRAIGKLDAATTAEPITATTPQRRAPAPHASAASGRTAMPRQSARGALN
jgi:hypothetical protein